MEKYKLHKHEIWFQIGNYKAHAKHFRVAIAGIFVVMSFILTKQFDDMVSYANLNRSYVMIAVMFGITTAVYYFVYDVIESQCAVMLLSARMSMLEKIINEGVGERVLLWETLFSPRFWSVGGAPGAANPSLYAAFYEFILVSVASIVLPAYFYIQLWTNSNSNEIVFRGVLALAILYSVGSAAICIYVATYVTTRLRVKSQEIMYSMLKD